MNLYVLRTIKQVIAAVPGTVWLKRRIQRFLPWQVGRVPLSWPRDRGRPPERMPSQRPAPAVPEGGQLCVLYRIIGNDLVPRHRKGQARSNLEFILEHEPELADCEKRFVVNRIVDPEEEAAILDLLEQSGRAYLHVPFDREAYREVGWDVAGVPVQYAPWSRGFRNLFPIQKARVLDRYFRFRNQYVMHNNGARNLALREGRARARWVLPWDGNCFLTADAWEEIRGRLDSEPDWLYRMVPMARITDNRILLEDSQRPTADAEPQLIFRADARHEFDEAFYYGRRPKVELLWRLGVPGKWDHWPMEPWDLPCPDYGEEAGCWDRIGWVARLDSGSHQLEGERGHQVLAERGQARLSAIRGLLGQLDRELSAERLDPRRPVYVQGGSNASKDERLMHSLREAADQALQRGPWSVVDKTTLPPSGNPHDYWHPAPFYWPNPIPGLPYVRRDSRRVPGTQMYEAESDRYDRTRLQRLFDDGFVLSLAASHLGEQAYGEYAAKLVRVWFVDPNTAMNPHLKYSQVRRGHNGNLGPGSGIIEMKDLYYFLDAVRLLHAEGFLKDPEIAALQEWMESYLEWLQTSEAGCRERASTNNHGTYYDLQVATIAAWLGDDLLLRDTLRDSRSRMLQQFSPDGEQPEEMTRPTTAHYCCFNLQGWIHLAQLGEWAGEDLWGFEGPEGQSIRRAMEWLLPHVGREWPYQQIDEFDHERFYPIWHECRERYGLPDGVTAEVPDKAAIKPLFFPHDGVRPFWQIR